MYWEYTERIALARQPTLHYKSTYNQLHKINATLKRFVPKEFY